MAKELELKLTFRQQDIHRIGEYLDERFGPPSRRTLSSTYYDTDRGELRARGLSYRVRNDGPGFVQTVKTRDRHASGALNREEIESAVAARKPEPESIEPAEIRMLVRAHEADLKPLFGVEVERASYGGGPIGRRGLVIDMDVGRVRAGRRSAPIRELEIESKGAPANDLYQQARDLRECADLRLSTASKAERGYELWDRARPGPKKAGRVDLEADGSVESALLAIVDNGIAQLLGNDRCVLEAKDPEGIHQMRVSLRRLRSAFRIFRPILPAAQHDAFLAELRWLTSALGPARDWDVFHLGLVEPAALRFPENAGLKIFTKKVLARRSRARAAGLQAVRSPRFTDLLLDLRIWATGHLWRDGPSPSEADSLVSPARDFALEGIRKRLQKARKLEMLSRNAPIEYLHELRIEIKRLRYSIEFFENIMPKKFNLFARSIARLQDGLGLMNDVAVARSLTARVVASATPRDRPALAAAGRLVVECDAAKASGTSASIVRETREILENAPF